jgi:general secretion pathway protein M
MSAFSTLSQREKILVGAVLPIVLVLAGFKFAWQPMAAAQDQARADISSFRLVQDTAALALRGDVVVVTSVNDMPLPARITKSAQDTGLVLRRIEPEGSGSRVTLDEAAFSTVLLWIADLEEQHDVSVRAIEIDRRPTPGIVSARLLLDVSE